MRDGVCQDQKNDRNYPRNKGGGFRLLGRSPKQRQAYARLREISGKSVDAVDWAKKWGISPAVIAGLVSKGLVKQTFAEVDRDAYADQWSEHTDESVESLNELTDEQAQAKAEIFEDLNTGQYNTRLLQGVTGSGNQFIVRHGKSIGRKRSIVSVPEIPARGWLTDCGPDLKRGRR